MKCIKNTNTNEVKKVTDEAADEVTRTKNWVYISRSDYKAATATIKESNKTGKKKK